MLGTEIPESFSGRIALGGSFRRMVNQYAACGWAMVQMDFDGGMTPWDGDGGVVPNSLEV